MKEKQSSTVDARTLGQDHKVDLSDCVGDAYACLVKCRDSQ